MINLLVYTRLTHQLIPQETGTGSTMPPVGEWPMVTLNLLPAGGYQIMLP